MSLSLETVPNRLSVLKYKDQSREDVSWHSVASEDRSSLICEGKSTGASGDGAGKGVVSSII